MYLVTPKIILLRNRWMDIRVGDLIKVVKEDKFPADMMLLVTPNKDGMVFVDTSNLDGETNLKDKTVPISRMSEKKVKMFSGKVYCDAPNHLLEEWDAEIISSKLEKNVICDVKNLLLRDCVLKNTDFCIGIAINLGKKTKIMMNSKKPKQKVSNMMRKMNYLLYSVFAFQLLIIVTFASLSVIWQKGNGESFTYLGLSSNVGISTWIVQLLTYWVTFSHMIPISLYVIIEMLKLVQMYLINKDIELYSFETNNYGKCNNSDLIEELGQVEFIFSDKTGTLTKNKMVLKKCSVREDIYGELEGGEKDLDGICESSIKQIRKNIRRDPNAETATFLRHFLIILGVCHTVVCDKDPNDREKILYQSSSPDELALVMAGKDIGYEMIARSSEDVTIFNKILNRSETFQVLCELPFTSDRKRMSMIIKDGDKILMYSKGADSIMLPRIKLHSENEMELQKVTEDYLHKFASEGLRVLIICFKEIEKEKYKDFSDKYDKLRVSKSKTKDEDINKLFDEMERNLTLIGCTAIEDKLQDGVPETIGVLREADINIWMLTGDKMETAIEIAKSCNLFDKSMTELLFSFDSMELINQTLDSELKYLELKELFDEKETIAVVVDGTTLQLIFKDAKVTDNFFKLCRASKSVVCCRVSPKQKSDIVDNYMKTQSGICIAIGDGANDVPMIMQAHIGVGIRGLEGTQAVRTADFAINQFSHLQKLLFVHGRWGYKRVAYMVCYYFYKNILLALTEIYFHFFNGYSGQIFFLDWLPMLYNSFFTSFPCLFTFSLEQDATVENSYNYPVLYKGGKNEVYFNLKVFWKWILFSIWHGATCFCLPMLSTRSPIGTNGQTYEHWYSSTLSFTIIVHIVTMKLFIESIFWNWLSILMAVVSLVIYYLILVIGSSTIFSYNFQKEATGLLGLEFGSLYFWILALIGPLIGLLPDFTYMFIANIYYPSPTDIVVAEQKGIREKIHERAKARAKRRRGKQDYQETKRKRRQKVEGDDSQEDEEDEEFEEEEEEDESEENQHEDEEAPPVTPAKRDDKNKKKRDLKDYVKDHDESEFELLKNNKEEVKNNKHSKPEHRKSGKNANNAQDKNKALNGKSKADKNDSKNKGGKGKNELSVVYSSLEDNDKLKAMKALQNSHKKK